MKIYNQISFFNSKNFSVESRKRTLKEVITTNIILSFVTVLIFYLSLIISSENVQVEEMQMINNAISVLDEKGFEKEVFLLRNLVNFRRSNNWLNSVASHENAYATTNFPFEIITIGEDFYTKANDETERAMILLHEAQHLQGKDEKEAYRYVWQNRQKLGWMLLTHGTTPTYVTIDQLTRENVPELFSCKGNLFNDCTEMLRAGR